MARVNVAALCGRWAAAARSASSIAAAVPASSARAFSTSTPAAAASKPDNVGILAIEAAFPTRYVKQTDLETFDKVSTGKYTIGLGQDAMAFVDDREDINSICMTAVQRLLDNYNIDPRSIGRLEVGTESFVDKSKSSKTTIMGLLAAAGNTDVEGATVSNACYGGTAALLNSAAWVESSEWDGRYALYVAGDIAVYEPGPARPTGGCGAIAVLVGPRAPLSLIPRTRTSHTEDAYDFYKPALTSEYPVVDGKLSQSCYLRAVDACYNGTQSKATRALGLPEHSPLHAAWQHVAFHSPYNKLVQQSFRRLVFNDARRMAAAGVPLGALSPLAPFLSLSPEATFANRDLDKALAGLDLSGTGYDYARMVGPSDAISKAVGNTYTGALHANLLSLVAAGAGKGLEGARIGAFSYGSGAIATMFGLRAAAAGAEEDALAAANGGFTLRRIAETAAPFARLAARTRASPEEFTAALALREVSYGKAGTSPVGSIEHVPAGAYYLQEVRPNHVRVYGRKAL